MAAEQGMAEAQYDLAWLYMRGWGNGNSKGVRNEEVRMWLERAAEQEHPVAQYTLGDILAMGYGGETKDYVRAYMWLQLSAISGYAGAVSALKHVTTKMNADKIDKAKELVRRWKPKKSR